jgi:hypothetical protein
MIRARKVRVADDKIYISTYLSTFVVTKNEITDFKIKKIPSLFDEITIELNSEKRFIITERIADFFALTKYLGVEDLFGVLWYRDAEDGRELCHAYLGSA